jgi:four helix bundle protein
MKENLIKEKSFAFALSIIALYKQLKNEGETVLSKQLLKCGTSIGANVFESEAAQSKADFISKMSIASKEARETRYWLLLLKNSELIHFNVDAVLEEAESIVKILTAIVKTSKLGDQQGKE